VINYRVDDLDGLREALKKEGVQIDPHREDDELGEVVDAHVKRQVGIFGTLTDSLCNRFKARDITIVPAAVSLNVKPSLLSP